MKRLVLICISLLFLIACCPNRDVIMTEHRLDRMYNLRTYNHDYKIYGKDNLRVIYKNNHDLQASIRAHKTVINLFKKHGYDVTKYYTNVDLRFILVLNFDRKGTIMYGYYDDNLNEIHVSRYSSNYCESFTIMDMVSSNPDLHESVIAHEMTHRYIHALFGQVSIIDHEYISYIFQISSFPPYFKYLWDKENKYNEIIETEKITREEYLKTPKSFGARMYKHHVKNPEYLINLFKKLEEK